MNKVLRSMVHLLIDTTVAGGLVAAMAGVYQIERTGTPPADPGAGRGDLAVEIKGVGDDSKPKGKTMRLALTPPAYDDMGKLLDTLGEGYAYETVALDDLKNPDALSRYDILFVTCRDSLKNEITLQQGLRAFVDRGGTLYASDHWYTVVASAFLEFVDPASPPSGDKQVVNARVLDPSLQALFGPEVSLNFDLAPWRPAAFRGERVAVLLEGDYQTQKNTTATAPLLVKFPVGKGTVIFTSFHNAKLQGETALKLLRSLVFIAATAEVESQIKTTMVTRGFDPKRQNLLSVSTGDPSFTETYLSTKGGRLQFALGISDPGARFRLKVVAPDGRKAEHASNTSFSLVVTDAQVGKWAYTLTAESLPYPNFPYTLTIGE